jgi:hypothetical protein
MQDDTFRMTNFLGRQKFLHIGALISTELNDFSGIFILLDGPVARKGLFEGFADAFNVQIVREARHRRDAFPSVALLDPHVDLFFRRDTAFVTGVFEGVCINFVR